MIRIDKLRLFPFKTKSLAIPNISGGEKYNFIFFPENSTFFESYYKLDIKKQFIRKSTLVPSRIPRIIFNVQILKMYRSLKLIPIRKVEEDEGNVYFDTSIFLDALDLRFRKGSYRRPFIANRVLAYILSPLSFAPNRKNILVYHIDYDKPFPEQLQFRRIFPLLWSIRMSKGEIPFDYVLLSMSSGGTTVYSALKNIDKSLPFTRLYSIFNSLTPRSTDDIEEIQDEKIDVAADKVVLHTKDDPQEHIDTTVKVKNAVSDYLSSSNNIKTERIIDRSDIPKEIYANEAIKSVLFNISGNKDRAEEVAKNIPAEKKSEALQQIKKDLIPEIILEDSHKNTQRDLVFSKVGVYDLNNNKTPSKVLNKRKVDFDTTFEKDLSTVFSSFSNKAFPLKLKKIEKKEIAIEPGDLSPSKYQRYSFTLIDDLNRDHIIDIEIPQIQNDGTFLINGNKQFLIYQIILDPIFFIKVGQAKIQTLFAAVSIHHKKTVHKSFFETYITGYNLPLFAILGYRLGFKKTCELYGIQYKISDQAPAKDLPAIVLSDKNYVHISYNSESALRLLNSFFELPNIFTKDNLENQSTFEKAIIELTENRNSIYKINKVIDNIMEPVSVQVLKSKLLPYTFIGCVKYICDELSRGRVDNRNDLIHQRIRSSEIFAHQIIKVLQASYSDYENKRNIGDKNAEFKADTRKVVNDIVNSELVRDLENINPIEELSSLTRITPVGIGGISDTVAVTAKDRSINESYYGNIDPMDTPEGHMIGVVNQLTVGSSVNNARGSFKNKYGIEDRSGILSPTTSVIPYIGSCDGARVMLSSSQSKQAIPINGIEQPLVQTGYETIMTTMLSNDYVKKSPVDGVIAKITDNYIVIKGIDNRLYKIATDMRKLNSLQGESSLNSFKATVKEDQKVKSGQIIAEGKHIKNGVISVGTNLLVAVMGWKGYSFEDGYIISDKIAEQKLSSESYEERVVLVSKTDIVKFITEEGRDSIKGEPLLIRTSRDIESLINLDEDELVEGQVITKSPGGKIISIEVYPNTSLKQFPTLQKQYAIFKQRYEETIGPLPSKFFEIKSGKPEYYQGVRIVFKIVRPEKTLVGDKLANNHGGKGVITLIEKYENMPVTPWGQPVDIILNPVAIINRMNPSTIFEMYTGLIGKFLAYKIVEMKRVDALKLISQVYTVLDNTKNKLLSKQIISSFASLNDSQYDIYIETLKANNYVLPIIVPQFQTPTKEQIQEAIKIVGAETSYYLKLPDYGTKTLRKVACGFLYYKKLEAQGEKKLAARSMGRYQGRTLQPLAGRRAGGGQRLGEFDTWALIDHGAINLLKEFFGPLSDDQKTKEEIISEIIETGEAGYKEPKATPTKDLLEVYLKGMMLEASIKKETNNR